MGVSNFLNKTIIRQSRFCIFLFSVLLIFILGWIDYLTGPKYSFFIFYLLPIIFAVWYGGISTGIGAVLLSAQVWFTVDIFSQPDYVPHVSLWNAAIRLAAFVAVAGLVWHLRLSQRRQKELIDFVVHDLRTPLSVIKEGLSLLNDYSSNKLNDEEKTWLSLSSISCNRMATLVTSILDLSRLEADKMPLDLDTADVCDLAGKAVDEVSVFSSRSNIKIELKCNTAEKIYTDRTLLYRVLINLLSNAIKISKAGSSVVISVLSDSENVYFSVIDKGSGIPKEAQKLLFNKFSQIKLREGGWSFGSGLGLNFCKLAVERLSGNIKFESIVGEGSTVTCVIPIKNKEEA